MRMGEFIASAKGRSGWGHHPYTQNTVVEPKEFSWDNSKYVLPNISVDYVNTIFTKETLVLWSGRLGTYVYV